jgi:penicillin-binding protein 1A
VPELTRALTLITTLDYTMQKAADDPAETSLVRYGGKRKIGQAALVALDPASGAVRAMVGGRSYSESPFNRAVQAMRQPGSAFKPIVYLTAMEQGMTPDTVMRDSPIVFGDWQPQNYGGHYVGPVTLRNALAMSINTVAVKVSERAGRFRVIDLAHKLGIRSELTPTPSVALGTSELTLLELTDAYAVFANGGAAVKPYGILEIRDGTGHVLYRQPATRPVAVADSWAVGAVNDMLAGVLRYGTGTAARLADRPAAGKTGTSQSWRDAWFVGYVPQLVAGVWMGNDDNKPMARVTGGTVPAQTWKAFMAKALAGQPARALPAAGPPPPGVYASAPGGAPETMGDPVPPGGPGVIESFVDRLRSAFQW